MKIRSELNALAAEIRSAAVCWSGGEKIKIGQVEMTVAQVAKNVLDKLNTYQAEEKSLKGRIETSKNLLTALDELRNKSPDRDKDLISTLRKINQVLSSVNQLLQDLKSKISKSIQRDNNDYINNHYINLSLQGKIIKNSFRTIKNVSGWREKVYADYGIGGSRQIMSHMTLKQDLEQFLASYHQLMTAHQQSLITEILPLLVKGAELDKEITQLLLLRLNNGAPDEVIESGIADISYEIEKSIDALKTGETFIFPGGYTHNGGHSILYEVQRVRDEDYHFSIFNTGLGAEFGQDFLQLFKIETGFSSQSRVPLFTQLKKEALVDQNFLSDLIRFQVKDTPNRMDSVHQTILKQFKEKFSAKLITRESHDLQTWGTCSYDSVAAFLEYKLPSSLFIPFQYDLMLKARNELTDLLPQGGGMDQRVLQFIDRKSCETLADWKDKFDQRCYPFGKRDLTIAKILNIQNMKDQEDLKRILGTWSDHDISDEKKLGYFDRISHKTMDSTCEGGGSLIDPFSLTALAKCAFLGGTPLSIPFFLGFLDGGEETHAFRARRQVLERIQGLIEQESPEAAKMLNDRNQKLGSGNQPVFGKEIDLSGVFNYLKIRYEEILMCAASLLNSAFSPLKEANTACPTLPAALTSDWQNRKLAAF